MLPREELTQFFYFIFRGILPKLNLLRAAQDDFKNVVSVTKADRRDATSEQWFRKVNGLISEVTVQDLSTVVVERQLGFLNMFEHLVRVLGHAVLDHIDHFGEMLLLMISASSDAREAIAGVAAGDDDSGSDEEDEEEKETDFRGRKLLNDSLKIRKLCILRLSELVHYFKKECSFQFLNAKRSIWDVVRPLVDVLSGALVPGAKPPALLKLVHALCSYPETIEHVVEDEGLVVNIIRCASRKCDLENARAVIESLSGLLDFQNGRVLQPHVEVRSSIIDYIYLHILIYIFAAINRKLRQEVRRRGYRRPLAAVKTFAAADLRHWSHSAGAAAAVSHLRGALIVPASPDRVQLRHKFLHIASWNDPHVLHV